jgi:hypothetical protein
MLTLISSTILTSTRHDFPPTAFMEAEDHDHNSLQAAIGFAVVLYGYNNCFHLKTLIQGQLET